jgi:hypothetical protein
MSRRYQAILLFIASHVFAVAAGVQANSARGESKSDPGRVLRPREGASADASSVIWRSERACGLNSLYFLLRCSGVEPDYIAMQGGLLTEEMSSLFDLKAKARDYGMALEVVRLVPEGLRSAPRPIIAHMEIAGVGGQAGGHFVVVTHTDDESVSYVDGSTAQSHTVTWRDFNKEWSGYAAYLDNPGGFAIAGIVAGFFAGAVIGWAFNRLLKGRYAASRLSR